MILTKDLEEILEGVRFFLVEVLGSEGLSARAECLRRGLVLQIDNLKLLPTTPNVTGGLGAAGNRGSTSNTICYLPMDQKAPTTTTYTSSSSLSSHSGCSSNSGSGDGLVLGGRGRPPTPTPEEEEEEGVMDEELYEVFDDGKEDDVEVKFIQEKGEEEKDEEEEIYTETHIPVSFSSAIASCERHGPLSKKTKGLLRSMKNYIGVAASGMLYLYLKESDDRQKKSIDLTGYTARSATGEEIKDMKKRDAAFEIVCPGRKTHTFVSRTARDKQEWLEALRRTIRLGRPRFGITPLPLPPLPSSRPPLPPPNDPQLVCGDQFNLYNNMEGEFYEEIGEEEEEGRVGIELPLSYPSPSSSTTTTTTTALYYDSIDSDLSTSSPAPVRPPPPGRPPALPPMHERLPDLPPAPQLPCGNGGGATGENLGEYDDIYCEIEEDELYNNIPGDTRGSDQGERGSIVSANTLLIPCNIPGSPTMIDSFTTDVFKTLSDVSHKPSPPSLPVKGPPKLPPKGILPPESLESEYNVPKGSEGEYQIPNSNPVEVPGLAKESETHIKPVTPLAIKPVTLKPGVGRAPVAEDTKPKVPSYPGDKGAKLQTSTSVKDMIAKLNQNNTTPNDMKAKDTASTDRSRSSSPLPKQHLKPDKPEKPPLPARPVLRGSPLSLKKEKVPEEDLYLVIDDDFEEDEGSHAPQQQGEWFVAKFAFVATMKQALSFSRGEDVYVYDQTGDSGWWRATVRARNGLVPKDYLAKK